MIDDKVKNREPDKQAAPKRRASTNVIDLVAVLQRSIDETKGGSSSKRTKAPAKSQRKKKAKAKATTKKKTTTKKTTTKAKRKAA